VKSEKLKTKSGKLEVKTKSGKLKTKSGKLEVKN
jgi:hypothetical protein